MRPIFEHRDACFHIQNINIHAPFTHTLVCIEQQIVPDEVSLLFNIEEKYSLYDYLLIAAILN